MAIINMQRVPGSLSCLLHAVSFKIQPTINCRRDCGYYTIVAVGSGRCRLGVFFRGWIGAEMFNISSLILSFKCGLCIYESI